MRRPPQPFSERILALASYARPGHPFIDICCDHGLIGIAALSVASNIHFVDQSEPALEGLHQSLAYHKLTGDSRLRISLAPGESVELPETASAICIAGVGGFTILRIAKQLFPQTLGPHRLILGPQKDGDRLLLALAEHGFPEPKTQLIIEKGRRREIFVFELG